MISLLRRSSFVGAYVCVAYENSGGRSGLQCHHTDDFGKSDVRTTTLIIKLLTYYDKSKVYLCCNNVQIIRGT